MKILLLLSFIILHLGCKEATRSSDPNSASYARSYADIYEENLEDPEEELEEDSEEVYSVENSEEEYIIEDGTYCANITYVNDNTGTTSHYILKVEVIDNALVKIYFPNGWLDSEDWEGAEDIEDGQCEVQLENGYRYEVELNDLGDNCFNKVYHPVQCKGITQSGSRCKRNTDNPSGYCYQHE